MKDDDMSAESADAKIEAAIDGAVTTALNDVERVHDQELSTLRETIASLEAENKELRSAGSRSAADVARSDGHVSAHEYTINLLVRVLNDGDCRFP